MQTFRLSQTTAHCHSVGCARRKSLVALDLREEQITRHHVIQRIYPSWELKALNLVRGVVEYVTV